jgi:hypothetical protein
VALHYRTNRKSPVCVVEVVEDSELASRCNFENYPILVRAAIKCRSIKIAIRALINVLRGEMSLVGSRGRKILWGLFEGASFRIGRTQSLLTTGLRVVFSESTAIVGN